MREGNILRLESTSPPPNNISHHPRLPHLNDWTIIGCVRQLLSLAKSRHPSLLPASDYLAFLTMQTQLRIIHGTVPHLLALGWRALPASSRCNARRSQTWPVLRGAAGCNRYRAEGPCSPTMPRPDGAALRGFPQGIPLRGSENTSMRQSMWKSGYHISENS